VGPHRDISACRTPQPGTSVRLQPNPRFNRTRCARRLTCTLDANDMQILMRPVARHLVLVLLLVAGCDARRRTPAQEHPWYLAPSPGLSLTPLPAASFHPVQTSEVKRASSLLSEESWVAISQAEAVAFVGVSLVGPSGSAPYLVRGLERFPNSVFHLAGGAGTVLVHSMAMGHTTPPTVPHPVVVMLVAPPTTLYVISSVTD
jgi:hypothetical protein